MENCKIIKRVYYAIDIELVSPLSLSGGMGELTDSDVLRNGNGECFVPGTSLAGAFRNALHIENKKTKSVMGYSSGEEGQMSSFYIQDMFLKRAIKNESNKVELKDVRVSIRDGIELESDKTVKNKYDMEIIETGAVGTIFMSYLVREDKSTDKKKDSLENVDVYECAMQQIIEKIQSGDIRLGGNKNRGFGRMKINAIYSSSFDASNLEEYLNFKKHARNKELYKVKEKYDSWKEKNSLTIENDFITIRVPLKLTGGISIRKYSTEPGKADYSHITCNGEPIIPGTSWNGAIRADVRNILSELGCNEGKIKKIMNSWFGFVLKDSEQLVENLEIENNRKNNIKAYQSNIVFGESVIKGATALTMTRNRINRFDNSTVDANLYTERSYFGGTTELEIMIRKKDSQLCNEILGMLSLVIENIQDGYVPVGGLVSIGRGIFERDEKREILYSENIGNDTLSALYSRVKEG